MHKILNSSPLSCCTYFKSLYYAPGCLWLLWKLRMFNIRQNHFRKLVSISLQSHLTNVIENEVQTLSSIQNLTSVKLVGGQNKKEKIRNKSNIRPLNSALVSHQGFPSNLREVALYYIGVATEFGLTFAFPTTSIVSLAVLTRQFGFQLKKSTGFTSLFCMPVAAFLKETVLH